MTAQWGRTVLVTGMGGELGTRIAAELESLDHVERIVGVDFVPPRRRLGRSEFVRIDPRRRDQLVDFVTELAPTSVAHVGVYEPAARMSAASAAQRSELATVAALSAASRAGNLSRVVVRSGTEIYGIRGSDGPSVPDESVPPRPSSPFGHSQLLAETIAAAVGRRHDIPIGLVRLAPVVGSHVPSPLGRLLRLSAVPVPALTDPPFSVVHPADAARALVRALDIAYDGPLNIVGPGAATPLQAVRLGGRLPIPTLGLGWAIAARLAELSGAAIAQHVIDLLRHGNTASGSVAVDVLGLDDLIPTQQVLRDLFDWARIVPMDGSEAMAA